MKSSLIGHALIIVFIVIIQLTNGFLQEQRFYFDDDDDDDSSANKRSSFDDAAANGGIRRNDYSSEPQKQHQQQEASVDKTIENVIVKVGQQATLPCFVNNLGSYKVIWAKNGDILALGNTKINSDTRLNVQHRYVSEWHLIIDNVVTDDEGEYICKTNGHFYKTINLQVLMPPTIDDVNSTPAGTLTVKEGSSVTLKCLADGKPEPVIKWYRWKKYKHLLSEKEELNMVGNEIIIQSIKRNDANIYECIAKNSVPPATSRIFNIEIQFLPAIELEIRKTFQFLHKKFALECKINSNPVDKIYWYKNGVILHNKINDNVRVEKYDISNINDYHKTLLSLTVTNANREDFGEYQCCASNFFGQTCSDIVVQEIKLEQKSSSTSPSSHDSTVPRIIAALNDITTPSATATTTELPNLIEGDNDDENEIEGDLLNSYEADELSRNNNNDDSSSSLSNSIDSKDKRRHYLMRNKDLSAAESQSSSNQGAIIIIKTRTNFIYLAILTIISLFIM